MATTEAEIRARTRAQLSTVPQSATSLSTKSIDRQC